MWKAADRVTSWYQMHCRKYHIINSNSEANTIAIFLWLSPVPFLNHIASKKGRLVTLWYRYHSNISDWRNNNDAVKTKIMTKEPDIRKHFCVSFFVVPIKTSSFTSLAYCTICSQCGKRNLQDVLQKSIF